MSIRIVVDDKEVDQALSELYRRGDNLSEPMREIAQVLETSARLRFETSTSPDKKPWKPSIRALLTGGKTLVDKAKLRDSIVSRVKRNSAEVGTNVVYAAIHQLGGEIDKYAASMPIYRRQSDIANGKSRFVKRGRSDLMSYHETKAHKITMPARPYLGVSSEDKQKITTILQRHLGSAWS